MTFYHKHYLYQAKQSITYETGGEHKGLKKLQGIKQYDPEWIKEIAEGLLDKNINKLSDKQIKMLRDLYLKNLRDGLKPKEAMGKAFQIVTCFKI